MHGPRWVGKLSSDGRELPRWASGCLGDIALAEYLPGAFQKFSDAWLCLHNCNISFCYFLSYSFLKYLSI